jgi:hypothetical protein
MVSHEQIQHGRRILTNRDGQRVASITAQRDGSRLYERFRAAWARDYLRRFSGFAIDAAHLDELSDDDTIRLTFIGGRVLTTTAGAFRERGIPFSFGRGSQVALNLRHWTLTGDARKVS